MKSITKLACASLFLVSAWATAAPDAAQVKASHDLLASMQAEKLLRMTAGMSKYASPAQRELVMAKIDKVTPEMVYTRLSVPVAGLLSSQTTLEMTRYYKSSYGQKLLQQTYNGAPRMYPVDPTPTAAEKAELKKPAFIKANQEFKAAEPAIRHEVFVLVSEINKGK